MRDSDYPLLGDHYWKSDRRQGQHNRSARDGEFLLPRIIEEFGDEPFSEEDFRDAFDAYVATGYREKGVSEGRKLNVVAALHSLVGEGYVAESEDYFCVTELGRNFSDQLTGTPLIWVNEDDEVIDD